MSVPFYPIGVFEKAGFKTKVISLFLVDEAVREMIALFHSEKLESAFAQKYRHKSRPDWGLAYPDARTVILLAVPAPMLLLRFSFEGAAHEMIVPPGYAHSDLDKKVEHVTKAAFAGMGCSARSLTGVPMKLLAVRSGLCLYGRNNITYCEGLGSFVELYGIVTDLDLPVSAPRRDTVRMLACKNCEACTNACPTGCIDPFSPIIHADRCLTYMNENRNDFPSWLDSSAHHTIVGCMKCQWACPKNRGRLSVLPVENAFDEEDIRAVLAGGEFAGLPAKTQKGLRAYNLDEYWPQLSRNLRAMLENKQSLR